MKGIAPAAARTMLSLIVLIPVLVCLPVRAASVSVGADSEAPIVMQWGVAIPMRDGKHLNATMYRPAHQQGRLPVILTITPYVGDRFHAVAEYFARHGYVFAIVDCRGRGNSEGTFRPFKGDGPDGYDAIEWLAKQSYADGQVAMWGGSYGGMNQWAVAATRPPALKTIVPASASLPGFDFPMVKNIFMPYMAQWVALVSGRTANNNWFGDHQYWEGIYQRLVREGVALRKVDQLSGNPSGIVQEWLDHPAVDSYWDALSPTAAQYGAITIPTLTIAGHYDADQAGALEHYRRHGLYSRSHGARDYLLLGPWDHEGTREPARELSGLDLGAASVIDVLALHVAWYDWIMKGGPQPSFLPTRVTWYSEESNTWHHSEDLAHITSGHLKYYLSAATSTANSLDNVGHLVNEPVDAEQPRAYRYDPLNHEAADLERGELYVGPLDDRQVRRIHGDGLIYETAAFDKATLIAGRPQLTLYVTTNVPDTDLAAAVYVVRADGSSILLGDDLMRLRYRSSIRIQNFMVAGKVTRVRLVDFPWMSRLIAKGSRLRLVIYPAGASVGWEHNYNSRVPVAEQTARDATVALVSVSAGGKSASTLWIPTHD
jgi:uncharacterized protein